MKCVCELTEVAFHLRFVFANARYSIVLLQCSRDPGDWCAAGQPLTQSKHEYHCYSPEVKCKVLKTKIRVPFGAPSPVCQSAGRRNCLSLPPRSPDRRWSLNRPGLAPSLRTIVLNLYCYPGIGPRERPRPAAPSRLAATAPPGSVAPGLAVVRRDRAWRRARLSRGRISACGYVGARGNELQA